MVVLVRRLVPGASARSGRAASASQPDGTGASHRGPGGGSKRGAPESLPRKQAPLQGQGPDFWKADDPKEILEDLVERGVVEPSAPQIIDGDWEALSSESSEHSSNDDNTSVRPAILPHQAKHHRERTWGHTYGDDPAITPSGLWLEWVPKWLGAFRATGVVKRACEAAGVNRLQYVRLLEKSPVFKAAVDQAYEDSVDALEDLARHRAMTASDDLLKFMLRGSRKKFREQSQDVKISGTGPGGSIPLLLVDNILRETKDLDMLP